jgi:ankyrin repeat domain-containing protein 50
MDPVSAAASIVAIVQISSAVLGTCYRYINKVKDAPADIFRIISEVGSLQVILDDLNSLGDGERLPLTTSLAVPGGPVDACLAVLKELEAKLSTALTVKKKLLWPFEAKKVDELVGKLQAQKSTINLAVTGDNTRATLGIVQVVADIQESIEDTKQRERRDRILQWLATTDPTTNHNAARDKHEPTTGSWLLESEGFRSWRDSANEFLWLHAIPGAGKTIICSTVIEHVTLHSGTTHRYAYYYFDFSDPKKQRVSEMLKSLISQLSSQSVRLLGDVDSLYEDCGQGLKEPSIKGLVQLLTSLLKNAHSYIIIDALDECTDREDFYPILRRLREGAGFSLLITSRKEVDIDRAFNPTESPSLVNHTIDIQHEAVSFDVRLHVRASLAKVPRLRNWPDAIKKEIEDTLANGAHGM